MLGEMADPGKAFPEPAGDGKESGKGLPRLPGTHTAPIFSFSPNKESPGYHTKKAVLHVQCIWVHGES